MGPMKVYRTSGRPVAANWVFDYQVTHEHRFYRDKTFDFVRELDPRDLILAIESMVGKSHKEELESLDCITFLEYKLRLYRQMIGD